MCAAPKTTSSIWWKWLRISKVFIRKDYKFSEGFRGKTNLQYREWNNKKLKGCVDNNPYDKKTKNNSYCPVGISTFLNPKHKILTFYRRNCNFYTLNLVSIVFQTILEKECVVLNWLLNCLSNYFYVRALHHVLVKFIITDNIFVKRVSNFPGNSEIK